MTSSAPNASSRSQREEPRRVGWVLLLPLPLAVALFGTVHPWARGLTGLVVVVVGLYAIVAGIRERSLSLGRADIYLVLGALLAVGLGLLELLPASEALRSLLQPGIAPVVTEALRVAGADPLHPLALNPRGAILASGEAAAAVLLAAAVVVVERSRRRMIRVAAAVVLTASVVVLLAWAQRFGSATTIYWSSGIPSFMRAPFFGPFVNPNHAAFLLAAALPLALVLATRGAAIYRLVWASAIPLLLVGLWTTTSRGGLISMVVGLLILALVAGPRWLVLSTLGAVALGVGGLLVVGLRPVAEWLTLHLLPAASTPDVFGERGSFWSDAWTLALGAPFVGVGQGSFGEAVKIVKQSPVFSLTDHAHQELLQALAEHGLVVGGLWILLCLLPPVVAIRRLYFTPFGRRRLLGGAFVGAYGAVVTGCFFEFPFRTGALSLLAAMLVGVLLGVERQDAVAPRRSWLGIGFLLGALGLLTPLVVLLDRFAPSSLFASNEADLALGDAYWDEALLAADETGARAAATSSAESARSALRRVPTTERAWLQLARAEGALGHTVEAREALSVATQVYPSLPWSWFALARFEGEHAQTAAARDAWKRGLNLDLPEGVDASDLIIEAFSADPNPAADVTALIPDRADRLRDAGRVLARDGRPEWQAAARLVYERSVSLDPSMGLAYANQLNRWGEPLRALALVEAVPDRNCGTLLTGAEALLALERAVEAVDWYQRARARCGKVDRPSRVGLAKAKAGAGDPAAVALLRELIIEEPSAVGLRRLLIRRLLAEARPFSELEPQFAALVESGEATPQEATALERIRAGLPPQISGAP